MHLKFVPHLALLVVGLCGLPQTASPQDADRNLGYNAIIDNIDLLVDNYARFLSRKYDLTQEQDEYTRFLLRERAYQFLEKHEPRLRSLVDRMFDVRTGGDMTQEELIEWGRQVRPIYEDAKRLIIDGNNEWREILTDEQRKIHDEDVKLMHESFSTTEDQLDRIVAGQMTVDEFRSPRRPARRTARPRTVEHPEPAGRVEPAAPAKGVPPAQRLGSEVPPPPPPPPPPPIEPGMEGPRVVRTSPAGGKPQAASIAHEAGEDQPPQIKRDFEPGATGRPGGQPERAASSQPTEKRAESEWEKYVREFIEKYKLNNEQAQQARAILADCQTQADRYLAARKEELEKIDRQIEELKQSSDKNKAKTQAELQEQRKKLMDPIDRIFSQQLKPRLDRLPTRAQRQAAEAGAKTKSPGRKPGDKADDKKPSGKHD